MSEFGWAHIQEGALTSSGGIEGSLQYKTGSNDLTGSNKLVFVESSGILSITGSLAVLGSITASNYTIENVSQIDSAGSSKFGNSSDDLHQFSGSVSVSGSLTASNAYVSNRVGIGTNNPSASLHNVLLLCCLHDLQIKHSPIQDHMVHMSF